MVRSNQIGDAPVASNSFHHSDRRKFFQTALAGALGGAAMLARPRELAAKLNPIPPGIKIAVQMPGAPVAELKDEDLQFVQQVGTEYVCIWTDAASATLENFASMKQKVESYGLKVWNFGNLSVHNMEEVTLNLPGRDQKIEEYKAYLRNLGRVGVYYTTYAHMGNGIWSTAPEPTRGKARARAFNLEIADKGYWNKKEFNMPLTHGRVYTEQEIWDNYTYFIKAVAPVAEEVGVRIGIHPDDPPVPVLGGVPRCIFSNIAGYKRALEIANSPNVGVCLCCGTWMEGGKLTGMDVLDAIRYFAGQKKLFKIHFRNINQPLPHFVETFIDNGYMDMYKIMKTLAEVKFDGVMIPDHVPEMVGGPRVGYAYSIAYMKAMRDRAYAEVKG
jgi:mannonate dehydratase